MKPLKKKLLKDWGPRCKDFSPLCGTCLVWRSFETMDKLYTLEGHLTKWKKKYGKRNNN